MIGAVIFIIRGFVAIKIINFDPIVVKVGDVVVNMRHSGFHIHVIIWLHVCDHETLPNKRKLRKNAMPIYKISFSLIW